MTKQPRGVRNNNPGNIVRDGQHWTGLAHDQSGDPRFCIFDRPELGIRALAKILLTYARDHGLETVGEIVARWAPPAENDTPAYVASVAAEMGVPADAPLDLESPDTLGHLVAAIIRHENGMQPYGASVLNAGVRLALA